MRLHSSLIRLHNRSLETWSPAGQWEAGSIRAAAGDTMNSITHWPRVVEWNLNVIVKLSLVIGGWGISCTQVYVTGPHRWQVNGLVPSVSEQLPEPMLKHSKSPNVVTRAQWVNTLMSRLNIRHCANNIFNWVSWHRMFVFWFQLLGSLFLKRSKTLCYHLFGWCFFLFKSSPRVQLAIVSFWIKFHQSLFYFQSQADKNSSLIQVMARHRTSSMYKPLTEPMMV